MSRRPCTAFLSRLLLAVFLIVAAAPPGGLAVCVAENGHMHLGAAAAGEDACLCDDEVDPCACVADDEGHADLAIEIDEAVERRGAEDLVPERADLVPLPLFDEAGDLIALPRFAHGRLAAAAPPRPSYWSLVACTVVMLS